MKPVRIRQDKIDQINSQSESKFELCEQDGYLHKEQKSRVLLHSCYKGSYIYNLSVPDDIPDFEGPASPHSTRKVFNFSLQLVALSVNKIAMLQ